VCFAKHTFNKHNLGRLGLKPRLDPLFFSFFLGTGLSPPSMGWAGPSQTSRVTSLVQRASVHELFTHACYSPYVIKMPKWGE